MTNQSISTEIVEDGKGPPKSIVIGFNFYGAGNIGDDLMLEGFISGVRSLYNGEMPRLAATSAFAIETQRKRFSGVDWIDRGSPTAREQIQEYDCWAGVGDTPFQITCGPWFAEFLESEIEGNRPRHSRVMVGVGAESEILPINDRFARIVAHFDRISTRDEHSTRVLIDSKIADPSQILTCGDLANIALKTIFKSPRNSYDFEYAVVVAPDTLTAKDLHEFRSALTHLKGSIALISGDIRPDGWMEHGVYEQWLARRWSPLRRKSVRLRPPYEDGSTADLVVPFARCGTVVSTRYHCLLAAAWAGCRVAAVGRSSKVTALATELGVPVICPPLRSKEVLQLFDRAITVDRALLEAASERAHRGIRFSLGVDWTKT